MAGSESTTPLITVGLILAVPLLNRFLRGGSPSPASSTAPSSGPHTRWYSPRHFSHRLTRLTRLSPSEWFLFLLFATLCSYHVAALNPFGQARRASRDLFLHTGLPIGASSASLRAKVASLSLDEVGLTRFAEEAVAAGEMGEAGGAVDLGGMSAGAGVGGDVLERLLRRLNSMGARVSWPHIGTLRRPELSTVPSPSICSKPTSSSAPPHSSNAPTALTRQTTNSTPCHPSLSSTRSTHSPWASSLPPPPHFTHSTHSAAAAARRSTQPPPCTGAPQSPSSSPSLPASKSPSSSTGTAGPRTNVACGITGIQTCTSLDTRCFFCCAQPCTCTRVWRPMVGKRSRLLR